MSFDLDHWRNPRETIATSLRHNDLAYATHGAWQIGVALRHLKMHPGASLLDFGCGTGRIARVAAGMGLWREVWGYDPVPECIAVGAVEAKPLPAPVGLHLTSDWGDVPVCEDAICVNVMEHLNPEAQDVLVRRLQERVKGRTVLWYRPATNGEVLAPWLTPSQRDADAAAPEAIQVRVLKLRA